MISKTIKIALVDDEMLFRQGLKSILGLDKEIEIIFDASDGHELLKKLKTEPVQPDIIVTDLNMPNLNGVETTKVLRTEYPNIKIIALTSYFSKPFIVNMISLGAVGYLAKNSTPELMITTIKKVDEVGFYYDQQVMRHIQDGLLNPTQKLTRSKFDNAYLTRREKEVLELICKEYSTNEIAENLSISPRTVEGHRNNLILKTGVKNIAGLVVFALSNNLVSLKINTFK